jgi:lipid II:glycine glycyltransferase (peptidoglycan interpeptide bridge formation enzyme)
MLTKFSLYNDDEMRRWDDFVMTHPLGTPFHLSSWIRIVHETYSFEPELSVYTDASGEIAGLFPYFIISSLFSRPRIVSMPFSDYCSPLACSTSVEGELLNGVIEKSGAKMKYIEIRGLISGDSKYLCHNHYQRYTLELDPDPSKVYKGFDKRTVIRSIKKAEKEGVVITESNTSKGVEEFYRLNKLTRKKHGVPCQPKVFFEKIAEYMMSKGVAFILLATCDSQVISASLFIRFKKSIYYKYNASDPAYLASKTPNHLLIWELVKKACNEGFQTIDFGRTAKDNKGLVRYKKMWGAKAHDLPYYYYPAIKGAASNAESGLSYRVATGIWKHLPDTIADRLGPILMKQLA